MFHNLSLKLRKNNYSNSNYSDLDHKTADKLFRYRRVSLPLRPGKIVSQGFCAYDKNPLGKSDAATSFQASLIPFFFS